MKHLSFWFDPVSPFAWLAFERLPQLLEGLSVEVGYRPVLLAAMLAHWGQKGPAEVEPKRVWTFRHVQWLASRHGIPLQTPAQHPFNPLALSRLMLACAPEGATPSRWVCDTVLRHVWIGGADANDPGRLADLATMLAPRCSPDAAGVKQSLRAATDEAIARGVFGVPAVEVDGRVFWGLDGLPMLISYLRGDAWFDTPAWDEAAAARPGVRR